MTTYDVIVIGAGGIGSAALFQLAAQGVRVLGLDRYPGAHDHGSSHGQTRIFRQAYFEHPNYVPLVRRALELWRDLERRTHQKLYYEVGLLAIGMPDRMVVQGMRQSAEQYGLSIDEVGAPRFRGFRVPEQAVALFEPRAGYLLVEPCVRSHQASATALGADLKYCEVQGWRVERDSVVVHTDREVISAGRLVVTAGAWARDFLHSIGLSLRVLRKPQYWFANHDRRYWADRGCPVFIVEAPEGVFYGFPQLDARGVKAGEHTGGAEVDDPSRIDPHVDPEESARVAQVLKRFLPGVRGPVTDHSVCMYTNSSDGHFILDQHPAHEQVVFATGLSGHGFKFAPVLGEALADLAMEGTTSLPIEFLGCGRFA